MFQVSYLSSKTRLNLIILKTIYGYDHKYLSRIFFLKDQEKIICIAAYCIILYSSRFYGHSNNAFEIKNY